MESKLFKSFTPFFIGTEGIRLHEIVDMLDPIGEFEAEDPRGSQWRQLGFIPVEDGYFTMDVQGAGVLCCVQISERILPGAVLRDKVREEIEKHEQATGRRPGKKEIAELKDDVVMRLLPQAFIRRKLIPVLFTGRYVLVFTSSHKVSDDVITLLANSATIGMQQLALANLEARVKANPPGALTELAREGQSNTEHAETDDPISYFEIANAAVLKGEGKKTVRIKDKDIGDSDMQALLKQDYSVTALRVNWHEAGQYDDASVTLTVNDHLVCGAVLLADVATGSEKGEDAQAAKFMTVAWMMATLMPKLLDTLVEIMGGLNEAMPAGEPKSKRIAVSMNKAAAAQEDDDEL